MNDRIRELRKILGFTLEQFGNRLGVSRGAMSNIENGYRTVTDQMAKSICREFKVDPHWLETGEGEMFADLSAEEELKALVYDSLSDKENPFFQVILATIKAYRKLTPEKQAVFHAYLKNVAENLHTANDTAEPEPQAAPDVAAAEAAYEKSLGIAPAGGSTASNTTGAAGRKTG